MNRVVTERELNQRAIDMFVNVASRDDELGRAIRDGINQGLRRRMEDLCKRLGIPHVPEDIT